ncbi:type II toxin-antitoxin system RelE/ParE family toxin [Leptolyngbya sp. FACHB-17]|uniref:type II toxin-antitoxin system RelE/ParE family toxin n=1 Tax=unclassified Leptolyngbya TaxID=2650499 RepID=UPI0016803E36|nr:type II toxin-antitoxin system RelE/ParE family toxin [Leptolyngbya sp. FACHB-17]MBD2081099.1 type II toxin-antitoxin system RelE/ParE family toxin [Leptolyngbya sp. FACHB-17]
MTEQPLIQVQASSTFKRNLRDLTKKYRKTSARRANRRSNTGSGYPVFKLRVRNSDTQKGKSGGYRLIYYLRTVTGIILLTIYTESEQADIAAEDIRSIISEYEKQSLEGKEND